MLIKKKKIAHCFGRKVSLIRLSDINIIDFCNSCKFCDKGIFCKEIECMRFDYPRFTYIVEEIIK